MTSKNLYATSISIEDNGIMIIGSSGSGKSDLALRLIDSGGTLISDDRTVCERKDNKIFLFTLKEIKGLIEVRGVGIIKVPYVENVQLKLLVSLTEEKLDRLPRIKNKKIFNISIPQIKISAKDISAVAKIKLKLFEDVQKK